MFLQQNFGKQTKISIAIQKVHILIFDNTVYNLRHIKMCTANNFGLMCSQKRISQNSFPN
jgi:hypothetical protein